MRMLWLIGFLTLAGFEASAFMPPPTEIVPGDKRESVAMEISSERLESGDVRFTVTISPRFSFADYGTSLGTVKLGPDMSFASLRIRSLVSEQSAGIVKCVFLVTQKELENPDLCFRFNIKPPYRPDHSNFSAPPSWFARLSKFLKP